MAGGSAWIASNDVTVNKRLLFGSLAVAAVASLVIGYAISDRSTGSGTGGSDAVVLDSAHTLDQPLDTNAVVQGKQLPRVNVETAEGDSFATGDLIGQPLIINFWSSTCIPCKKELPDFTAVHDEFGDKVRIVGIDALPSSATEQQFAKDHGVDYELFYDTDGAFGAAAGISSQPVTLFIRPDGTIIKQTGQIDAATLRSVINTELL
jgi:thiol-disulfide isomerase/thioredoxin